ncbi:hypothetical protein [uncultured Roseibium sp.]|uniref:hypothetical protein n=1 Tax=uncultured Roseibium sp. TaxID=1936171 RepID=UPI00262180B8|nr:hypothetical protein [uncultured Roseibium sp.]
MNRFFAALCLLSLMTTTAKSDVSFWYQDGNWTVWNEKAKCKAVNRPVIETSHAPYMSFWFVYDLANPGVAIDTYFWPGVFVEGTKFNVDLLVSYGEEQITVPASAGLDFALRTERPLSQAEIDLLVKQNLLIVKPENSSVSLAVDAVKIPIILQQLQVCVDVLSRATQKPD